jgi:alpha-glucosidase
MPWDGTAHAGFSSVEPWLPLNPDWRARNVAAQAADPTSMLALTRNLLALRRAHPALQHGSFRLVPGPPGVLQYERRERDQRLFIALNLSAEGRLMALPPGQTGRLVASTHAFAHFTARLHPDEGQVIELRPA